MNRVIEGKCEEVERGKDEERIEPGKFVGHKFQLSHEKIRGDAGGEMRSFSHTIEYRGQSRCTALYWRNTSFLLHRQKAVKRKN
jgi:hypothetical protein